MDLYIHFHHFYSYRVNECVQEQGEDVITKVINKPIKYKVNIPVCRYETVPGEPYTYTVNKPKIEYRKMCYDVPQPKCSQTPCQNTGVCPPQTNACANDQTQTNTVCPLSGKFNVSTICEEVIVVLGAG